MIAFTKIWEKFRPKSDTSWCNSLSLLNCFWNLKFNEVAFKLPQISLLLLSCQFCLVLNYMCWCSALTPRYVLTDHKLLLREPYVMPRIESGWQHGRQAPYLTPVLFL